MSLVVFLTWVYNSANMYESPLDLYHKISPILQEPLNINDLDILKKQLSDLESIRYELSYKRCNVLERLLRDRERSRMPKDKTYTDLDRKVMLDSNTSLIESDYQFIQSLEEIIKTRIELGITILQTL